MINAADKDYCEIHFISEVERVRPIVLSLLNFIDRYNPSYEVRNDLRLIFSELLYNAVIHGNNSDPKKSVNIQIKVEGVNMYAQIQDEGSGFDYQQAIKYAESEKALLDEHSRGMILVHGLTDNMSFNDTGNLIRVEKRLK